MQHNYVYDWFCYLLPFRLGCAVNTAEKDSDLVNQQVNNDGVCREAPGYLNDLFYFM